MAFHDIDLADGLSSLDAVASFLREIDGYSLEEQQELVLIANQALTRLYPSTVQHGNIDGANKNKFTHQRRNSQSQKVSESPFTALNLVSGKPAKLA